MMTTTRTFAMAEEAILRKSHVLAFFESGMLRKSNRTTTGVVRIRRLRGASDVRCELFGHCPVPFHADMP
jgi:hypothetical protein